MSKKSIQQQWQQSFVHGQVVSYQANVHEGHLRHCATLPVAKSALALGVLVGMSGFSTAALATSNSQQFLSAEALSELDDATIAAIIQNQQYELNAGHLVTQLEDIKTLEISITTTIQPVHLSDTYLVQADKAKDDGSEPFNTTLTQQDEMQLGVASQLELTTVAENQIDSDTRHLVKPVVTATAKPTVVNHSQPLQPQKVDFLPPLYGAADVSMPDNSLLVGRQVMADHASSQHPVQSRAVLSIDPTPVALELTPLHVSRVAALPPMPTQLKANTLKSDTQHKAVLTVQADKSITTYQADDQPVDKQPFFGVAQAVALPRQQVDKVQQADEVKPRVNKPAAGLSATTVIDNTLKTIQEFPESPQKVTQKTTQKITQTDALQKENTKQGASFVQHSIDISVNENKLVAAGTHTPLNKTITRNTALQPPSSETATKTDVILGYPMTVKLFAPADGHVNKSTAQLTQLPVDDLVANANADSTADQLGIQAKIHSMTTEMNPSSQIRATNQTVNAAQLQQGLNSTLAQATAYTDTVAKTLGYGIQETQDSANAGTSAAMAMAAMPQAFKPGKTMVAGGIANYNGQSAVAVGISTLTDNGRWVLKMNGSADTKGDYGIAAGAGMHW